MSEELKELVQVAAVAVGSIENREFGRAEFDRWLDPTTISGWEAIELVAIERRRQDEKWGYQDHSRIAWAMILAEEIGEWAEELRNDRRRGDEIGFEGLTAEEIGTVSAVLKMLYEAGEGARRFLENHEWPERQQTVYNREMHQWHEDEK